LQFPVRLWHNAGMGFLSALDSLLNENSDNSLEKKLGKALDKVESTLGATLDKAESGIKAVDQAGKKLDHVAATVEKAIDKTDQTTSKISID